MAALRSGPAGDRPGRRPPAAKMAARQSTKKASRNDSHDPVALLTQRRRATDLRTAINGPQRHTKFLSHLGQDFCHQFLRGILWRQSRKCETVESLLADSSSRRRGDAEQGRGRPACAGRAAMRTPRKRSAGRGLPALPNRDRLSKSLRRRL